MASRAKLIHEKALANVKAGGAGISMAAYPLAPARQRPQARPAVSAAPIPLNPSHWRAGCRMVIEDASGLYCPNIQVAAHLYST